MSAGLQAFIAGLPKAELHLHIEGTLEPEMLFELAARNRVALPYPSIETAREAYRFTSLEDFLAIYYRATAALKTAADFYELAMAYLKRAAQDNVLHAEIFFDLQAHTRRGVRLEAVIEGIDGALADGRARHGITSRLILCFLRDLDAAEAEATLAAALPYRDRIIAVGLDSAEVGHPPAKFAAVFERARAAGFLTVAHAGEEGPPDYVRQALDLLKVRRIDHGVRALEDPALTARLAESRVPLTVCPLSNLRLRVVDDLARHPLRRMLDCGIVATVSSDDPAYFGGYVNDNLLAAQRALDLGREHLITLARNSFEAAFLDRAEKAALIARLNTYVADA